MPSGTHIAEAYTAIEALLKARNDLQGVQVRGLTGGDFDGETARLVVRPPAVLLAFTNERLAAGRHPHAVTYDSTERFQVICGAQNLRGTAEERIGALELLATVSNALAGAKLTLASSPQKALVTLVGVTLGQFDDQGTWYTLEAEVYSKALFEEKT